MMRPSLGKLVSLLTVCSAVLPWTAEAASLTVNVRNGLNGDPMAAAFVMVGPSSGLPFAANTGTTDASGTIVFDDPGLIGMQTVTAGFTDFGYTTLYRSALDEVTLTLYPARVDEDMGGDHTRVEGEVDNVETTTNDGFLDASIILNAVSPETVMFFDYLPFLFGTEAVEFPVVGTIELPENVFITPQTELLFFVFSKSPYRLGVPGNRPVSFVSVTARAAISELNDNPDLSAFEIREIGVERDVDVAAPGIVNLDINSDINTLPTGLTMNFVGVPGGSATRIISGSTTGSGNAEELFGYSTISGLIDENATYSVASFNPTNDLSDASNVALAEYSDPSAATTYSVGIIDRSGFSVPTTIDFDSWLLPPALEQNDLSFEWEDPTDPGTSPTPTWTRSAIGLRSIDTSSEETVDWRIWARADAGAIELPVLPPSAPGPAGGLTDPATTPENDQLSWSWTAVNSSADLDVLIGGNFLAGGTHWTQGWIPIVFDATSAPVPSSIRREIAMASYPSPSQDQVSLRFSQSLVEDGVLEVVGADGRRVAEWNLPAGTSDWSWDGRDRIGQKVAGGLYWGRLLSGGKVVATARIVRLK